MTLPRNAAHLAVYPEEVMQYQLSKSYDMFRNDKVGEYTLWRDLEAHILGERIYLITNDLKLYSVKHYTDPTTGLSTKAEGGFERYMYEVQLKNMMFSRGFFIRACGIDLTNVLLFKFYAYKAGLLPEFEH